MVSDRLGLQSQRYLQIQPTSSDFLFSSSYISHCSILFHLFIHLLNKYLLISYYITDTAKF